MMQVRARVTDSLGKCRSHLILFEVCVQIFPLKVLDASFPNYSGYVSFSCFRNRVQRNPGHCTVLIFSCLGLLEQSCSYILRSNYPCAGM